MHKYKAVRTEIDCIKFPSKKEARRYLELKQLRNQGDVLYFLMQVPMHLDGGVKYIVDFVIFYSDGRVVYEDVKGIKTNVYTLKKKLVQAKYPIKIIES